MRLDNFLANNLKISRNQARELIKNLKVKINDKIITKTSFLTDENTKFEILEDKIYVSRAANKLKYFLLESDISIANLNCLDIGSSTGGFIEVLLEFGANKVVGVDVGNNQIHNSLRNETRLKIYENTDIRDFKSDELFEIITCDVSFIGINEILNIINSYASNFIIILFKPQFEVGKSVKRDKKGVVKDEKAILQAMRKFEANALSLGWNLYLKTNSKIKGKEGNEEVFYAFKKI